MRAEYTAWRMGLELLYQALTGKLAAIAPLPAAAPWRPWAGEGELHGRPPELFKGRREDSYRCETREQAAARRRAMLRRRLAPRTEEARPTRASPGGKRGTERRNRPISGYYGSPGSPVIREMTEATEACKVRKLARHLDIPRSRSRHSLPSAANRQPTGQHCG